MAINLPEILLDLHKNRRSGVFRIERKTEKKQLVLCEGRLAFAESNLPEEHLVRVMVKMDLLPRSKVSEIASLMKSGKTSEEAVFALSGLDTKDIEKGRREQAVVILASLLAWDEGSLHFYPGESLVRYYVSLNLSLPELLVLSARRAVSNRSIVTPAGFLQGTYAAAKDLAGKARELPLNSAESFVLSQLQEPMRTRDLLPLIPASEGGGDALLLRLGALGLISLKETQSATESAEQSNPLVRSLEDLHMRFEGATLYEILSVPADASPDDIQKSYHELAKQFHPDRFQSKEFSDQTHSKAQQVFTSINEAYLTLKDPASRIVYDRRRVLEKNTADAELKTRNAAQMEDERTAQALFNDARALMAKSDFEKAVERLNACVFLRPDRAAYHHYLGTAQSELPKFRKSAEQHLLKAIELDATSIASRLELAKLYLKVMLRRKAELRLLEVLRWDPENQEAQKLTAELGIDLPSKHLQGNN